MEISRDKEKQRQLREMDVESLAKLVFRLLKESVYLNHPHRYDFFVYVSRDKGKLIS